MRKIIIAFLLAVSLTACTGMWKAKLDPWKGNHIDELILNWTPPYSEYITADGRKMVKFTHSRFIGANQYFCHVNVKVDQNGIIENYSVDGNLGGCNYFLSDVPEVR